jgi:hypothetical protein
MGSFPISNYARLDVAKAEKDPWPAWLFGSDTLTFDLSRAYPEL